MKTKYMLLISATLSILSIQATNVDATTVDTSNNTENEKVQSNNNKLDEPAKTNTQEVIQNSDNQISTNNNLNTVSSNQNEDLNKNQQNNVQNRSLQTASSYSVNNSKINPITTTDIQASKVTRNDNQSADKTPLQTKSTDNDSYDQMLQTWKDMVVGEDYYDSSNHAMNEISFQQDEQVTQLWNNMNKTGGTKDNLWSGAQELTASANVTTDYRDLQALAIATANPGSKYYQNKTMINDVVTGFNWMTENKYNANIKAYGNWWDWEIGSPEFINNIVTIMYPYLTEEQIKGPMDAISKFVPDPYFFRGSVNSKSKGEVTGANQVDISKVKIIQALLEKDDAGLRKALSALDRVFPIVNNGEGFYADGSFIQHENVGYNGSYGNVLMDGVSQLISVVQGTPYALSNESMESVNFWIDKGFSPFIYKGNTMDYVRGRAISRGVFQSNVSADDLIASIVRVTDTLPKAEKMKYQSLIKYWLSFGSNYDTYIKQVTNYRDIALIEKIMNDDAIVANDYQPDVLTNFSVMDKILLKNSTKDYAVAINLSSKRIKRYESLNSENIHGWYTGDGMLYIYNNDLNQFNDDYWATVDPYKMPGTTETDAIQKDGSGAKAASTSFVGGSTIGNIGSIGNVGSIAMDFSNNDGNLFAHKSWFITKDSVVSLGSSIKNKSKFNARTIIDNRKLSNDAQFTVYVNGKVFDPKLNQANQLNDVKSIFLESSKPGESMGYKFLTPQNINLDLVERKGAWSEINKAQSENEYLRKYLEIYKNHVDDNDTYNYVTYPNTNFNEFNMSINPSIIKNDDVAQAVSFDNNIGVNIFKKSEVKIMDMEFDNPISVTRINNGNQVLFGIADPSQDKEAKSSFRVKDNGYKLMSMATGMKVKLINGYWNISLGENNQDGKTYYVSFSK